MRVFAYERSRDRVSLVAQDALLAGVFGALLAWRPEGALGELGAALRIAIPIVLLWGWLTLHFPTRVEVGDGHIAFERYGRKHRFERHGIESISVRRFLVRDRVLIRIVPAPPWRGRYWLLTSLPDIDELLSILATFRL
ncbi:hypothetical protein [Pendulispora albinea]|uniref:PH domain-containing protein n=1 Tax=Pendulispora albinea TaxID=2741071 RepID=A0ABZ2LNL4_9BACT